MSKRMEHVESAADECRKLNATFSWERGNKNIVGKVGYNGQTRKLFMSVTPSDFRAASNIRKNVRAYVREMGEGKC